jgi:spore photoproduct lyase
MGRLPITPERIFIDAQAQFDALTRAICAQYPHLKPQVVESSATIAQLQLNPKKVLYLTHRRGSLVKDCPGIVPGNICCRYQVINQTLNCPLNCSYCILQDYLNQPATVIYTDTEAILAELETLLATQPRRFWRFGTGELSDSLALPGSRFFARQLIEHFALLPNALLELKTKTTAIDEFLALQHNGRTVLAWSVNPSQIIRQEEPGTATLQQRLRAAQRAQAAGYLLAFHFDPLILFPNAEEAYTKVVDQIFSSIDPDRVVWISLGSLRFPPTLTERIRQRHPATQIIPAEMVKSLDGKLRYFRPLRVILYRTVYQAIKARGPEVFVYLCMETPPVWEQVTGQAPQDNAHLDFMFAANITRRFPYLHPAPPEQADYC